MIVLAACGGAATRPAGGLQAPTGTSAPPSDRETPEPTEGSVELTLRLPDGSYLEVGEQRGNTVLLYVFATFDAVSQMLLNPLRNVAERNPDVRIIGIAAQPSARLLVDAYVHALNPPFPITYDPRESVRSGESTLGPLDAIPTIIVLDHRGVEVARHTGFADEAQIQALLREARP